VTNLRLSPMLVASIFWCISACSAPIAPQDAAISNGTQDQAPAKYENLPKHALQRWKKEERSFEVPQLLQARRDGVVLVTGDQGIVLLSRAEGKVERLRPQSLWFVEPHKALEIAVQDTELGWMIGCSPTQLFTDTGHVWISASNVREERQNVHLLQFDLKTDRFTRRLAIERPKQELEQAGQVDRIRLWLHSGLLFLTYRSGPKPTGTDWLPERLWRSVIAVEPTTAQVKWLKTTPVPRRNLKGFETGGAVADGFVTVTTKVTRTGSEVVLLSLGLDEGRIREVSLGSFDEVVDPEVSVVGDGEFVFGTMRVRWFRPDPEFPDNESVQEIAGERSGAFCVNRTDWSVKWVNWLSDTAKEFKPVFWSYSCARDGPALAGGAMYLVTGSRVSSMNSSPPYYLLGLSREDGQPVSSLQFGDPPASGAPTRGAYFGGVTSHGDDLYVLVPRGNLHSFKLGKE